MSEQFSEKFTMAEQVEIAKFKAQLHGYDKFAVFNGITDQWNLYNVSTMQYIQVADEHAQYDKEQILWFDLWTDS